MEECSLYAFGFKYIKYDLHTQGSYRLSKMHMYQQNTNFKRKVHI